MRDVLIRNASIYDGSGAAPFQGVGAVTEPMRRAVTKEARHHGGAVAGAEIRPDHVPGLWRVHLRALRRHAPPPAVAKHPHVGAFKRLWPRTPEVSNPVDYVQPK